MPRTCAICLSSDGDFACLFYVYAWRPGAFGGLFVSVRASEERAAMLPRAWVLFDPARTPQLWGC